MNLNPTRKPPTSVKQRSFRDYPLSNTILLKFAKAGMDNIGLYVDKKEQFIYTGGMLRTRFGFQNHEIEELALFFMSHNIYFAWKREERI